MKIFKLMKGLKKYLIIMVIFSVVQVLCELYLPNIMSDVVDIGIKNADTAYITKEAIYMLIVTVICLVSNILVVYSTSKFSNQYGYNIRGALYKKINTFCGKKTILTASYLKLIRT